MKTIEFSLNDTPVVVEAETDTPLLWVLRDSFMLKGTKYGCGIGQCGACSVMMDGRVVRSCLIRIDSAEGKSITTIEGVSRTGQLHPVQKAWVEEQVPQCGYCQSGQIMTAIGFLQENPDPTDAEIVNAMSGNLCRCGTYPRIVKAVKRTISTSREHNQTQQ